MKVVFVLIVIQQGRWIYKLLTVTRTVSREPRPSKAWVLLYLNVMNIPHFDTIPADCITTQTLVGSYGKFPRQFGNCFSVRACGKEYRILNFKVENLEHLIEKRGLSWPVQIHVLSDDCAVLHDSRIPHDFYSSEFCACCTPYDLLPLQQKLHLARRVLTREDVYSESGIITSVIPKTTELRTGWRIVVQPDKVVSNGDHNL